MSDKQDYRNTVFLPATPFPMRGDLPRKEPAMLERWERMGLWKQLRAQSAGRRKFILHDGPPYANGNIHIGTALNKILKDIVNRAAQMAGFDADYIPGWDCHGLPIEWKVEEGYRKHGKSKDDVPILQLRAECRAYATHWLSEQMKEFRRLGVLGNWEGRYATMDLPSEAAIFAEIGKFLLNGGLFRGLRPVMWSPVEKTALAEAEVEYYDHTSTTIWVRFPVVTPSVPELAGARIVIWTTTPWTMPANRAIAAGPDYDYVVFRVDAKTEASAAVAGETLVVCADLLEQVCTDAGITGKTVLHRLKGAALKGTVCAHPLRGQGYDFDVPVLLANFVTTDTGTGFVHIAPSHGADDFILGRANGIETPETVKDDGTYSDWIPLFAGLHVYKATEPVLKVISEAGGLLARGEIVHSYPHSWRSKAPVIFRATPQWFIRMDGEGRLREKALEAINATHFVPAKGHNRLYSMVEARPDWCISRQRAWGVPIAVFVEKKTGQVLRDAAVVERITEAFRTEGADAWFSSPPERFLGPGRDPADYEQVRDIVDVWFESGSTHAFVLEARKLPWPADLYLEGSDQHRGWFHSSLLEAVGTRGRAPFKSILTHGFVLDEQGRKMSKSLGNTVAPQQVCDKYGADILRLWVAMSDTAEDLRIGPEILKQQADLYRRLRNTLRWLLGALEGFDEAEKLPYAELPELERWVLHRLTEFDAKLRGAVESHDWTGVYPALHAFCAADLSAFYFDIRKDALYCDRPDSIRRRAARTVLDQLHRCLATWLAPVLCFTAEEAWTARFGAESSVHLQDFPTLPAEWHDAALATRWAGIRDIRRVLTGALERARAEGTIGSSLQAAPVLHLAADKAGLLPAAGWAELAIVSDLALSTAPAPEGAFALPEVEGVAVAFAKAEGTKCARCWKVLPEVDADPAHPGLCRRCADAVASGLVGRG